MFANEIARSNYSAMFVNPETDDCPETFTAISSGENWGRSK